MTEPVEKSAPGSAAARQSWRRLSSEERRAQLMAIAERLFRTKPYDAIGMQDVADEAGITRGLVYHYFPSKEALFIATFAAWAEELLQRCASPGGTSFVEQAAHGVRGYLDFCEAHAVAYVNLFRGPIAGHEEFQKICEATRAALVSRLVASLALDPASVPATRLSLRGYLGYAEAVVLDWLDRRIVSRDRVEQLILAIVETALAQGLSLDGHAELASGLRAAPPPRP